MKITIKIIAVTFYGKVVKFRVINRNESEIFECHFINSEHHDFVNSYQTDYFIVTTDTLRFIRVGKLTSEELTSIWSQIEDVYSKTLGQDIIID